jgi:hypothetical protein
MGQASERSVCVYEAVSVEKGTLRWTACPLLYDSSRGCVPARRTPPFTAV